MVRPHVHLVMPVNNISQMMAALEALGAQEVLVGIPEDKTARKDGDGATNAEILYVNDKGDEDRNIPARPVMLPGVEDRADKIAAHLGNAAKRALDGDAQRMIGEFNAAGMEGVSGIRNRMTNGEFRPLSRRTLAARRARGRTGEKPWLDTGQVRNALTHVLRRRKKG